jgi:predicted LPLAT superfamily acyltransferase
MNFKPCLLIPIFNHKESIRGTIKRLAAHDLPIIIVDDGSAQDTQDVLEVLAAECPLIRMERLPQNCGKGAAVMHGMRLAFKAGYSHALQIDADGQHNAEDVPLFLARGAAHPESIICGSPVYDSTVPKGRLYGRYITHFWVWVETLSFAIEDSLCGFRLYPLKATCALIDEVQIPKRMDFDTAIIVRLYWRGIRVENIPTKVTYPPGGISHFNMLRDNLRITKMHTVLTCGMLLRLPLLLWRKFITPDQSNTHWSRLSERGSKLGLLIVFACYRLIGQRAARLLLYPIVGYFFITSQKARAASLDYLRKVRTVSTDKYPDPGWRDVFLHMLAFAQSGLDKLAAWMGSFDQLRINFPNSAEFERLIASRHGALFIGSHLGNLEMTRALAHNQHRATINAVVFSNHAMRFHEMLTQINPDYNVNLIQVAHFGVDTAIRLKDKINRGELVFIVGDRTPPTENHHVSLVDFLGQPAPFAQGPLILASLLECPVYLFFCLRENDGYHIYLELFADRIQLPRKERLHRLEAYLQQYATRLESHCLKAPYQWFNFYDFWQHETP